MFQPRRYQRSRVSRRSGASVLLRLVLLIAAWQGPVPWCHTHAAQASADTAPWLAEHLQTHHSAADPGQRIWLGSELGWHFHADFPTRPVGDDEPRPGQPPAEFPASCVSSLRAADGASGERLLVLTERLLPVEHDVTLVAVTERLLASSPGNFFTDYAAALPLPLRFCILRC